MGTCERGKYLFGDRCVECAAAPFAALALLMIVAVAVLVRVCTSAALPRGFFTRAKMFITFVQLLVAMVAFTPHWPNLWLRILNPIRFFNVNMVFDSLVCYVNEGWYLTFWLMLAATVGVGAVVVGYRSYIDRGEDGFIVSHGSRSNDREIGYSLLTRRRAAYRWLVLLGIVCYFPLAMKMLETVHCVSFQNKGVLVADRSIECASALHIFHSLVAVASFITFCLAVPWVLSWMSYQQGSDRVLKDQLRMRIGEFFECYRDPMGWFEGVSLLRKCLVAMILVFVPRVGAILSLLLLNALYTAIVAISRPFNKRWCVFLGRRFEKDNNMEIFSNTLLCCNIFVAFVLHFVGPDRHDTLMPQSAVNTLVLLLLILLNSFGMVVLVYPFRKDGGGPSQYADAQFAPLSTSGADDVADDGRGYCPPSVTQADADLDSCQMQSKPPSLNQELAFELQPARKKSIALEDPLLFLTSLREAVMVLPEGLQSTKVLKGYLADKIGLLKDYVREGHYGSACVVHEEICQAHAELAHPLSVQCHLQKGNQKQQRMFASLIENCKNAWKDNRFHIDPDVKAAVDARVADVAVTHKVAQESVLELDSKLKQLRCEHRYPELGTTNQMLVKSLKGVVDSLKGLEDFHVQVADWVQAQGTADQRVDFEKSLAHAQAMDAVYSVSDATDVPASPARSSGTFASPSPGRAMSLSTAIEGSKLDPAQSGVLCGLEAQLESFVRTLNDTRARMSAAAKDERYLEAGELKRDLLQQVDVIQLEFDRCIQVALDSTNVEVAQALFWRRTLYTIPERSIDFIHKDLSLFETQKNELFQVRNDAVALEEDHSARRYQEALCDLYAAHVTSLRGHILQASAAGHYEACLVLQERLPQLEQESSMLQMQLLTDDAEDASVEKDDDVEDASVEKDDDAEDASVEKEF